MNMLIYLQNMVILEFATLDNQRLILNLMEFDLAIIPWSSYDLGKSGLRLLWFESNILYEGHTFSFFQCRVGTYEAQNWA